MLRNTYVGDCGNADYIREDAIEQWMLEHLVADVQKYNVSAKKKREKRPLVDEVGIKRKMSKLKDLYLSDLIEKDEYESSYNELRAVLFSAQKQQEETEGQIIDIGELRGALRIYGTLDRQQQKEFWGRVVRKIKAEQDGTFSFTLRNTYKA